MFLFLPKYWELTAFNRLIYKSSNSKQTLLSDILPSYFWAKNLIVQPFPNLQLDGDEKMEL